MSYPAGVLSHGGGLNAQGCHNVTRTGGYHCHRSSYTPRAPAPRPPSGPPVESDSLNRDDPLIRRGSIQQLLPGRSAEVDVSAGRNAGSGHTSRWGVAADSGRSSKTIELQQYLVYLGYDIGLVDGRAGIRTLAALKAYKRAAGLAANDVIDEAVLSRMANQINLVARTQAMTAGPLAGASADRRFAGESNKATGSRPAAVLDSSERELIERAQFFLGVLDLYEGPRDGLMNTPLKQSILRFQVSAGLSADGTVSEALVTRAKQQVFQ